MKRYEPGEIMTMYFIINTGAVNDPVKAWSDDKNMIDYYLKFHRNKKFKTVKKTDTVENIYEYINENVNDEIDICYIETKDPSKKNKMKQITVPLTEVERMIISEDINTFMASYIDYTAINDILYYLKPKYQRILKRILLVDIIDRDIDGKQVPYLSTISIDHLKLLFRIFKDEFGR